MNIISWNINGIRAVEKKGDLQHFLSRNQPDIVCFQEIKAHIEQLSPALQQPEGYDALYHSAEKKGYAGTSIWAKKSLQCKFFSDFPENPVPGEGRVSHVEYIESSGQITHIFGVYFPNGGKSPEAWEGKLQFYHSFLAYITTLHQQGQRVIWGGDLNCAHTALDLARPKENDGKIGFHPKEREWLDACVNQGWRDIWREQHPGVTDVYSWWDPVTRSRERNVGWRIDSWWIHDDFFTPDISVSYLHDQFGSDHCPIIIQMN